MSGVRSLRRAIFWSYLAVTFCAVVFTMSRVRLLPWPLIRFSYGMMAPYQSVSTRNADLVARGLQDGRWETIDLDPYYPHAHGERNLRKWLLLWRWESLVTGSDVELKRQYGRLAQRLREAEAQRGRRYDAIELLWERWPMSPEGFEALRQPLFTESTRLARVP